LAQETFLRFFKSEQTVQQKEAPSHYLKVIAANLWRNTLRENSAGKREGKVVPLEAAELTNDQTPTALDSLISQEQKQALQDAIRELPPRMRHCMVMRVYQGLKYREIAAVLRLNVQTVKSQLSQAKARLKERLSRYFDTGVLEE